MLEFFFITAMTGMDEITCLVCGKKGTRGQCHASGWRLAPSRVGGYTCGKVCDDVITTFDEEQKAKQKAEKKRNKGHG